MERRKSSSMFRSVRKSASAATGLRHVFTKKPGGDGYQSGDEETKQPPADEEACPSSDALFAAFAGRPVPDELAGLTFAFEVGGGGDGWLLDCAEDAAATSRFPAGAAPEGLTGHLRYRDEATFQRIETKELSVATAMMTGKLRAAGDLKKMERLDAFWDDAKASVQKVAALTAAAGGKRPPTPEEEEAEILKALAPRVEPRNPCTAVFWKRHFGTDALVGSYLFLLSSVIYLAYAIYLCMYDTATTLDAIMSYGNLVSAAGFTLGSVYFIKLSYPEVAILMVMRAMREDVSKMSYTTRYFTHNEMLLAIWGFQLGFAPYVVIACAYLDYGYVGYGVGYLGFTVVSMALMGFWLAAAMPENMCKNDGQGSSYFYDGVFLNSCGCCVAKDSSADAYWRRHLGNDFLAGAWIFCVFGVTATIAMTYFLILEPTSFFVWVAWLMTAPFGVGAVLFVRSSYPDTMNTSICCGSLSYTEHDQYDAGWRPPLNDAATPLMGDP